jgi:hypothetical protein
MMIFRLLGLAVFLAGVYAVGARRAQWILALALAAPAMILASMQAYGPNQQMTVMAGSPADPAF